MAVRIINQQRKMRVPRDKMIALIKHVMRKELGREVNVNVAVVSDRRIAELNEAFLGHPGATDVLAFPFGEGGLSSETESLFGEIVISADRAEAEARARGLKPELELLLYAVHGMLHLCGYLDGTAAEKRRMRVRETEVLRNLKSSGPGKEPS